MGIVQNIANLFKSTDAKLERISAIEFELEQLSEVKDLLVSQYNDISKALSSDDFNCKEEVEFDDNDYIKQLADIKHREKSFLNELDILKSNSEVNVLLTEKNRLEAVKIVKSLYREGKLGLDQLNEVAAEKDENGAVKYADVIVVNDKWEILLLKRSVFEDKHKGAWVIPGGHVDKGESYETAAKRELREESGISVDKLIADEKLQGVRWDRVGEFIDKNAHIEYYCLHINEITDIEILLDELESRDYKWVPREELVNYPMVFNMRDNILNVMGWDLTPDLRVIEKAVELDILPEDILEKALKHKYIERTGTKGNYQYKYVDDSPKVFKYSLKVGGINFVTNAEQEYSGQKVSPFESKGSFKATIRKSDLVNIFYESKKLVNLGIEYGDSLVQALNKIKDAGITEVEIFKNKFVFEAKPVEKSIDVNITKSEETDIEKSFNLISEHYLKGNVSDELYNTVKERYDIEKGRVEMIPLVEEIIKKEGHTKWL